MRYIVPRVVATSVALRLLLSVAYVVCGLVGVKEGYEVTSYALAGLDSLLLVLLMRKQGNQPVRRLRRENFN